MSLKSELDVFYTLFERHLNGVQKATLVWVTCKTVDWNNGTMTAVDDEGLEYHHVMLGVGSTIVKPALESDCLIGVVSGHDAVTFLIAASEAEQIVFNGGQNGGLVNIAALKKNLDSIKGFVEAMHSALPAALSAIGVGSAANGPAGSTNYSTAMQPQKIEIGDMENTKVEH